MSDNTIYLVTGANRGLGLAVTTLLLARPNTTVIATARKPAASLSSLLAPSASPTPDSDSGSGHSGIHPTSLLLPILLDESDPAISSSSLLARLRAEYPDVAIPRLDVVLANAGSSVAFKDVFDVEDEEMVRDFEVNAVGPARLFRAVWPLLERRPGGGGGAEEGTGQQLGKFVVMSSSVGSIGVLDQESFPVGVAYGMSKAAANWWAKKVSVELKGRLVVGVLHPGWVQTAMGQALADALGFEKPPMTLEQSATACVEQIDNFTPEKSGKFLTYSGEELPW